MIATDPPQNRPTTETASSGVAGTAVSNRLRLPQFMANFPIERIRKFLVNQQLLSSVANEQREERNYVVKEFLPC